MTVHDTPIRADAEMRKQLERLGTRAARDSASSTDGAGGDERANLLLARIVWSRLVEPGDRAAGSLIAALGPVESLRLISTGGTARALHRAARERSSDIEIDPRSLAAGLKRWLPRIDRAATLDDLARGAALRASVLIPENAGWPRALDDLGISAPISLWVRGDPDLLPRASVAIVGARAATGYGEHVTSEISDRMGQAGYSIVSGAAYGIDAAAHRTALATEAPTVAVLAGGISRPYPESHRSLLERIAESGAVCTEMVPDAAPTRWRFLQRNRNIAALANGLIVTEAGIRSGSLNTAGHAAEIGRPLGAVPGPVTSAASAGCHRLIKEYGAALVTGPADALELLSGSPLPDHEIADSAPAESSEPERERSHHVRILDALPLRGSRALPELARRAGLTTAEARGSLAELELLGRVLRRETPESSGDAWSLVR